MKLQRTSQTSSVLQNISALLLLLLLTACAPLIGPYSETAYKNATDLKPKTLAVLDKATEPYASHKIEVEALIVELKAAHEYVKGVPSYSHSARQWELLVKDDGNLIGKFHKRWREQSVLKQPFVTEFNGIIAHAFDEIICLEANRKSPTACR
jgi:hypothetical protein